MTDGVSITIRDGTCYLSISDSWLFDLVVDATSFQLEGVEHRVKDNRRDKRTKLVRNQKCPVGLLDRVCRAVSLHGITPQISYADTQTAPKPRISLRLRDVEPRDYQLEAELAAMLSDRGIFRVPTGGGKTLIAAQIVAIKGMHAVIVVPTIDLLRQTRDYLTAHLAYGGQLFPTTQHIGQLGDGVVDPQPVTVATIRTIAKVLDVAYESYAYAEYDDSDDTQVNSRELKDWVESLGTVVVDEAHQLGAEVLYETVTRIPAPNKYGMSASPWRDDGADLMIEAATGPPIFHVTAGRLVEGGYLMAPEIRVIDTSAWWHSAAWGSYCTNCGRQRLHWTKECTCGGMNFRSQYTDSYRKEIVDNEVRNGMLAGIVYDLVATGRPTLVLVKQVRHGRLLAKLLPQAVFLSGKDKGSHRQDTLDRMRRGELMTIVLTTIGDMGLDVPNLGALVLAGGGKSSTRHLQRIGRVVRPSPGKETPIVVDLDDSHIHSWYGHHTAARRKIEHAEWEGLATWVDA